MKAYILMFAIATVFLLASLPVVDALDWPQDGLTTSLNKVGKKIQKQATKRICQATMGNMAGVFGLGLKLWAYNFQVVADNLEHTGYNGGSQSAGCPAPNCVDTCMTNGGSFSDCMDACE